MCVCAAAVAAGGAGGDGGAVAVAGAGVPGRGLHGGAVPSLLLRLQVTRLSVCFGQAGAFIDEAIGRAAHIQFLEDHTLIHLLTVHFAHLLD